MIRHCLLIILALFGAFVAQAETENETANATKSKAYEAARRGDLDTLRQLRFEGQDLFIPDERGFIPYEIAAMHADPDKPEVLRQHVEIMLWLKEYKPEKHQFGQASVTFVQAGLNALGYDAGKPDGLVGERTVAAIRAYQKDNGLAETGRLGPQWLGLFYQDILKDMQFKLTDLGYDTKGVDGLMGNNTQSALNRYRESNELADVSYSDLDGLLVGHIDQRYQDKRNKAVAATKQKIQQAKEKETRFTQAALKILGYRVGKVDGIFGSKTENALKAFQKKEKIKVTGKIDEKTQAALEKSATKETQRKLNALGFKSGTPDGVVGRRTQKALTNYVNKYNLKSSGIDAALLVSVANRYNNRSVASRSKDKQPAKAKAPSKTSSDSKTASKDTKKPSTTTKKTPAKRPSDDVVNNAGNNQQRSSVSATSAKGTMTFNRQGGRVVGCRIAGKDIPIEWCEPFYPLPKNNHCEASFKPQNGDVINLWCK